MFTVVVATLAVNIAANVVSPANDFANAFPRLIELQDRRPDHRHPRHPDAAVEAAGRSVGLHLHVAARLLRAGSGSIAGVLIADYWLVRRTAAARSRISISPTAVSLAGGWNWRAVVATLVGCALAWGGLVVPALKPLYDYAWFVGFAAAFGVYLALMGRPAATAGRITPPRHHSR